MTRFAGLHLWRVKFSDSYSSAYVLTEHNSPLAAVKKAKQYQRSTKEWSHKGSVTSISHEGTIDA